MTEEEASRIRSKCARRVCLSLACFSITASLVIFLMVVFLFENCPDCSQRLQDRNYSYLVTILGTTATLLFFLGGSLLTVCWKRGQNSPTPQVVVSLIPAEDLEKSPAPLLPYNHIPRHQPFVLKACSLDLPDYFTVTQNIDKFSSSVNAEIWTSENVPETPPPCYEKALEMRTLVAIASEDSVHNLKQENTEVTMVWTQV